MFVLHYKCGHLCHDLPGVLESSSLTWVGAEKGEFKKPLLTWVTWGHGSLLFLGPSMHSTSDPSVFPLDTHFSSIHRQQVRVAHLLQTLILC